ncbi:MAG: TonB-dependent receptor [Flavobacteriales bacterium]|nr:TonB-dependent receptor [Flavobacteriales bacterium]
MFKFVSLWFFMGLVCSSMAQTLSVVDADEGTPLSNVRVSVKGNASFTETDKSGRADISIFRAVDTFELFLPGYQTMLFSLNQLEERGRTVQLSRSSGLLNEVVVSSFRPEARRHTSIQIEPLQSVKIDRSGSLNLSDALTQIPGVSMLSTGPGVSKPVIRGLYGNRILVLFSGLRFDNQQWQDEHGLGLSTMGISKAEVVKGPLSVLYGTEALGGVINIIEEKPVSNGKAVSDFNTEFHSNTMGIVHNSGIRWNTGTNWFRFRIGVESHTDYSDGNGERVLNSRFNGLHFKASAGFTRKKWSSENHYHFAFNQFGFLFNDLRDYMEPDHLRTRQMKGPHHNVMLHILSSVNDRKFERSKLQIRAGAQSNYRSENEGGAELSLIMHLLSAQIAAQWETDLSKHVSVILRGNSSFQQNRNFGKRRIIPDAELFEQSISAYLKSEKGKFIHETGFSTGVRYIHALPTAGVNSLEKDIDPFKQYRPFVSAMLGSIYNPMRGISVQGNLASGVRSPNLAELSSNGLHEGVYTYEIGDPKLFNERNINAEIVFCYSGNRFEINASAFYNHFTNYIFLEPTDRVWFGFPIALFMQDEVRISGQEITANWKMIPAYNVYLSGTYSGLIGRMSNRDYLPFMPAQRIRPELRIDKLQSKIPISYCFFNAEFVLRQDRVAQQEVTTPSYQILNAGIGFRFKTRNTNYVLNCTARNLLNEAYFDHLSRLKNFGYLNMGRDITISIKIISSKNLKNQIQ